MHDFQTFWKLFIGYCVGTRKTKPKVDATAVIADVKARNTPPAIASLRELAPEPAWGELMQAVEARASFLDLYYKASMSMASNAPNSSDKFRNMLQVISRDPAMIAFFVEMRRIEQPENPVDCAHLRKMNIDLRMFAILCYRASFDNLAQGLLPFISKVCSCKGEVFASLFSSDICGGIDDAVDPAAATHELIQTAASIWDLDQVPQVSPLYKFSIFEGALAALLLPSFKYACFLQGVDGSQLEGYTESQLTELIDKHFVDAKRFSDQAAGWQYRQMNFNVSALTPMLKAGWTGLGPGLKGLRDFGR